MIARLLAALAAASLAATPAVAADMPVRNRLPVATAHQWGTSIGIGGGWGWGGGYRDRYRHRRGGSTAGDILTGVLILGTIAAVASAAKRSSERRSYPYRYPNPDRRDDYRVSGPQALDGAADLCLREVEREARAREVSRVERNASGWLVTGSMADGAAFTCSIGADGRIDRLEVGGRSRDLTVEDRQYGDETYRAARADQAPVADAGPQPAYPGGPLPGDEVEPDAPDS